MGIQLWQEQLMRMRKTLAQRKLKQAILESQEKLDGFALQVDKATGFSEYQAKLLDVSEQSSTVGSHMRRLRSSGQEHFKKWAYLLDRQSHFLEKGTASDLIKELDEIQSPIQKRIFNITIEPNDTHVVGLRPLTIGRWNFDGWAKDEVLASDLTTISFQK